MPRLPVAERREALIAATIRVMEREGIVETTTRKIAADAGMPLASLHYAFASRGELIAIATRVLSSEVALALGRGAPDERELDDAIRAALRRFRDFLRAEPGLILALREAGCYGLRVPELAVIARDRVAMAVEFATYFLARAAAASGRAFVVPVEQVASALVEFTDGLALSWLALRDDRRMEEVIEMCVRVASHASRPLETEEERRVAREAAAAMPLPAGPRSGSASDGLGAATAEGLRARFASAMAAARAGDEGAGASEAGAAPGGETAAPENGERAAEPADRTEPAEHIETADPTEHPADAVRSPS